MGRMFALTALILLLFAGCTPKTSEDFVLPDKILIDGLNVSNKKAKDALELLQRHHERLLSNTNFAFFLEEQEVVINALDLGISLDAEEAVQRAKGFSNLVLKGDAVRIVSSKVNITHLDAFVILTERLKVFDREPLNAEAIYNQYLPGYFQYIKDQPGRKVVVEKALSTIETLLTDSQNLGKTLKIPVEVEPIQPEHTLDSIKINYSLLSEFTTAYKEPALSSLERVSNIETACAILDGTPVLPGEVFDINLILLLAEPQGTWMEEPSESGDNAPPDQSGISQVSSTLYNAALLADLEITERTQSSYPVAFVPIGREAVADLKSSNFQFTNNTTGPLIVSLIVSRENSTVTARIFGVARQDGVTIQITSEQVNTLQSPGDKVQVDESLPPKTRIVERLPRDGKVARTYKHYYNREGTLYNTVLLYETVYPALEGLIYVSKDYFEDLPTPSQSPVLESPTAP